MKLTRTYYFQYGTEFTPDALIDNPTAPPAKYPSPSGEYPSLLDVSPTISAYINIPFKVKTIHVKGITWTNGRAGNQGNTFASTYITVLSSLVGNRPIGMVHTDSQFAMGTKQDIEHTFLLPEVINGYYTFTPYYNDGSLYPGYDSQFILGIPDIYQYFFDSFSVTLEFNSEEEL
jgi:hypothetical protein